MAVKVQAKAERATQGSRRLGGLTLIQGIEKYNWREKQGRKRKLQKQITERQIRPAVTGGNGGEPGEKTLG